MPRRHIDEHILDSLSFDHQALVTGLENNLVESPEKVSEVVEMICDKMEREGVVDLRDLTDETRLQATMEYAAIGLTNGVFGLEDFKEYI